jgi:hypothetical protein
MQKLFTTNIVKNAVSVPIQEQQKADAGRCSIMVYNFPEEGKDYDELLNMFTYLGCRCDIVKQERFGRAARHDRVCPLKIVLRTLTDASMIVSRAKILNNDEYYASVRISKWLSPKELGDLKRIRHQCEVLNQAHPVNRRE